MSTAQPAGPALAISRLHHPVTSLGPGRRVGLWLQGCTVGCRGCMSTDTWDAAAGPGVPVEQFAEHVGERLRADPSLTGLTVSGGEPMEQVGPLIEFLGAVRALGGIGQRIDVLLYSGWKWRRIRQQHPEILELVDAVIPEPFVAARAPGPIWRGSANQPLILLTELARARYPETACGPRPIQVGVTDGRMWLIGVPRPGDMDRMLALAGDRGVSVEDVSWRG